MSGEHEYYMIKTVYSSYYVDVWHQYPDMDKVYVGARYRCVSFSVYLDSVENGPPNMDGFGFHETCNIKGNLGRSRGTKHMLSCALQFLKQQYGSDEVYFKDQSTIQCREHMMSLPNYSILHYGKTWYERHFKASLVNKKYVTEYRKAIKNINTIMSTKPSYDKVMEDASKGLKKMLSPIYDQSINIYDFVKRIKDLDCAAYKGWSDKLFNEVNQWITFEWKIDIDDASFVVTTVSKLPEKPAKLFVMEGGSMYRLTQECAD